MSEYKLYTSLDANGLAKEDGYFTIHNYSCTTHEYIGSSDEYLSVGVGIPAYSLAVTPPDVAKGYVAIVNDGAWDVVPDYRGKKAYAKDGTGSMTVSLPGELEKDYTLDAPKTPYDRWAESGWVTDTIKQKSAQISEAEITRDTLLNTATQSIVVWQTKLLRSRQLTEAEASALDMWLDYIEQLEAIKTEFAPNINWPTIPKS